MDDRPNILDLSHDDLVIASRELGQAAYRARQLLNWLYDKRVTDFSEMTNIPEKLQLLLDETFRCELPKIITRQESFDGSIKYLFELSDGEKIEAVAIRSENRLTLCVSSQVGCKLGCAFCRTAGIGFKCDLMPSEITGQLMAIEEELGEKIDNVVFMGMGEPLDNLDYVLKAIDIFTHPEALAMSPRRLTVSTAGLPEQMKNLKKMFPSIGLSVSINASDSELRSELMPIEKSHSIDELFDTIRELNIHPQNPVTIEYVLLKDVNDSVSHAESLLELLRGTGPIKVNLIRFNQLDDSEFDTPDEPDVLKFQEVIRKGGIECFIRKSAGPDISAACGQLAADYPFED